MSRTGKFYSTCFIYFCIWNVLVLKLTKFKHTRQIFKLNFHESAGFNERNFILFFQLIFSYRLLTKHIVFLMYYADRFKFESTYRECPDES